MTKTEDTDSTDNTDNTVDELFAKLSPLVEEIRSAAAKHQVFIAKGLTAIESVGAIIDLLREDPPVEAQDAEGAEVQDRDPIRETRERLQRAVGRLEERHAELRTSYEKSRIGGKIEGVKLAMSYLHEEERMR